MPDNTEWRHPILCHFLEHLHAAEREAFEERAAILEFDAGVDRPLAEALAMLEAVRLQGWPAP